MPRRKTTIGKGDFGHAKSVDSHAWEVLNRILTRNHPLTEDAIFLCMYNVLSRRNSRIFQKVNSSSNVGEYKYFNFSPDIDLLEVRQNDEVVGYELKGYRRKGRSIDPPMFYEGIDQALAYLINPTISPLGSSVGSIFDYVYIVHPYGSGIGKLADLLERCTPIGLVVVERHKTVEAVKPRKNPWLDEGLKSLFLSRLDAFQAYTSFKVKPIQ